VRQRERDRPTTTEKQTDRDKRETDRETARDRHTDSDRAPEAQRQSSEPRWCALPQGGNITKEGDKVVAGLLQVSS
jgi:hypothetical protein